MQFLSLLFVFCAAVAIAEGPPLVSSANIEKRAISEALFDDLFFYFQYASSAYNVNCSSPNGDTLIEEFSEATTDTQGFIARDDNRREIVIALRGSTSVQDYLEDGEVALEAYTTPGVSPPIGTEVHTGILTDWNSVALRIISAVGDQLVDYPDYSIVTSGHSLGGALSSLAAVSMISNFPSNAVRMYTYGEPRLGNPTYAYYVNDLFGSNAYRFVHTTDGVPTMISPALGYRHHGMDCPQNSAHPTHSFVQGLSIGRTQTLQRLLIRKSAPQMVKTRLAQTPSFLRGLTLLTSSILTYRLGNPFASEDVSGDRLRSYTTEFILDSLCGWK